MNVEDYDLKRVKGEEIFGVYVYFNASVLSEYLVSLIEDISFVNILNKCLSIVHREVNLMRGEIYSHQSGNYFFAWHFSDAELFKDYDKIFHPDDIKQQLLQTRVELAFAAISSALFKLRVFLKNYTFTKHDLTEFKMDNLVSFSMHIGPGVKGVTGGDQKVDLTLLSDTVNATRSLTQLTTIYGCDFIVTDIVHDCLSPKVVSFNQDCSIPLRDRPSQFRAQ